MSKEYGTALFMLAKENGAENEYADALETVLTAFHQNPDYINFLASPSIPKQERIDAVEQAFGISVPEHIVSFIKLLCERGRIFEFNDCVKEYKKLLDISKHISVAQVTSSIELTVQEKEKLQQKLEKISGHSVVLECSVDKSLLGGIIIEMDGKIIDGSLQRRLHEVKDVISR